MTKKSILFYWDLLGGLLNRIPKKFQLVI